MAPIAAASPNPSAIPDASAPPPAWTTILSSVPPAARSSSVISQDRVAPPSIARPLSGPWQVNGMAPSARASWRRRYEGSPASPGRRGQTTTPASRSRSRSTIRGSAASGTKTRSSRPAARARTAAARAALPQLAMASGLPGSPPATRLGHAQLEQDPEQVARLVRARHVARLVLDPDRPAGTQPGGACDPLGPRHRRDAEPATVHASHGVVELAHEVRVAGVAPARGPCDVVGVEQRSVPDERVRVRVRRRIEAVEVDAAGHHVVDVVARPAAGAAGRERLVRGPERAATGAGEPGLDGGRRRDVAAPAHRGPHGTVALVTPAGLHRCHARPPATRSLNSPISSSHRCTTSRVVVQNAGRRRASNSSTGTPCCSTQVK